jgi:hypothetical protein
MTDALDDFVADYLSTNTTTYARPLEVNAFVAHLRETCQIVLFPDGSLTIAIPVTLPKQDKTP